MVTVKLLAPLLILLPSLIYWCIDEKKGLGLSAAFLLSMWVIFFLEYQDERLPFEFAANGIIAAVIIGSYILFAKKIENLFVKSGFRAGMIASAAVSFLMIFRLSSEKLLIPGGILLGMGTGFGINCRYVGFRSKHGQLLLERTVILKYLTLIIRFLLGAAGFILILFASGKVIPEDSGNVNLYNFIRYALSGFWVSAAAPWIFIRLRLAQKEISAAPKTKNEYNDPEEMNDT